MAAEVEMDTLTDSNIVKQEKIKKKLQRNNIKIIKARKFRIPTQMSQQN